ncbi:hypothetical protein [Thiomonas sp.]|uniref:hypothetical protein n=1 Tax=Thiomonas sp. TaxID=2047785 RepID=UPI002A369455|nr:hypothetical protein [Thiomonas sp.]
MMTHAIGCLPVRLLCRRVPLFLGLGLMLFLGGCTSLLPRGQSQTSKPWTSFDEAHAAFERIQPFVTTTAQLKAEGIDPSTTPNITILHYADIMRRLLPPSGSELSLDPGIRACLRAQAACRGYEIDQRHIDRKRMGNFWLDFLDFRRETVTTGWRFNMLLVVVDDRVVFKLWGGQPEISEIESTRNPLGPLQGIGQSIRPSY